ncbi:MAG: phosphate starvation protein PhoH [Thermosynechococcus sp.]|uniref:PhoH family protein n=1 Tax=Thermosynechococcus sp. TaxID=2814275 RepID=UPI0021FB8D5D|nr:PhoH family protein [Thermosynechococcus sp.]BCX11829.1 MAG: phosphate starvation protein PhoH [Thermosynechococcus sp.]
MTTRESLTIDLHSIESAIALVGEQEANLRIFAAQTGATLVLRGRDLYITGTPAQIQLCQQLIQDLSTLWREGRPVSGVDILTVRHAYDTQQREALQELQQDILARTRRGDIIRAKTFRQRQYVQAIRSHTLTFGIGPAGTGKTFLATVLAVQALLAGTYERLILTRPAVEAGERLGFLPGDLQQKIDPYLRPLYDALYELVEPEKISNLMERGVIEVAPLAYMRGRTLNNAFVILDEAQNTTPAQMKMVLTRIGFNSCLVVTGDLTQTDLPEHQTSGLSVATKILKDVEGIAFCYLTKGDVIRHPLVERIIDAYDRHEQGLRTKPKERASEHSDRSPKAN